jgi:hypothetical protein
MSMQGHMQREKKACRLAAPFYLTEMEIMYERSRVSGLSTCIPGEGVVDSMPNEKEDHVEELLPNQFTPSPFATNQRGSVILQILKQALERKGRIQWLG